MPNIIEQQDLLKGLPDDRLSMLMQNPTGDIPPFLVAAEAQRRQSIREQFSGGPQESVVDTLTKQIASVPQNIQAPMQEPPRMPGPPNMGGAQQMARSGGLMQRYSNGSVVEQSWPYNTAAYGLYNDVTSFFSPEPKLQKVVDNVGSSSVSELSYEDMPAAYQLYKKIFPDAAPKERRFFPEIRRDAPGAGGMSFTPALPAPVDPSKKPRDETAGQKDTSIENQDAATEAALRSRLEALYGQRELSGAEKAEKWFAMAQNFFKRGQSLGESIANAGAIYSQGAAGERAAQREADIAREKALLEWDMSQFEADRSARSEAARDKLLYERELAKEQREATAFSIKDQAIGLSNQIESLGAAIAKLDPIADAEQIKILESALQTARAKYDFISKNYGGVDYSGLRMYNPDGTLAKI